MKKLYIAPQTENVLFANNMPLMQDYMSVITTSGSSFDSEYEVA